MQKKKSSYNAKKEKLLLIKTNLESYYEIHNPKIWMQKDAKIIIAEILAMKMMLELIWEIVKDEKAK